MAPTTPRAPRWVTLLGWAEELLAWARGPPLQWRMKHLSATYKKIFSLKNSWSKEIIYFSFHDLIAGYLTSAFYICCPMMSSEVVLNPYFMLRSIYDIHTTIYYVNLNKI